MESKTTWGHDELAADLASKFRCQDEMMVWENMPMGPAGSCRPDVFVLKKTYTQFRPITYEVKVSKADFLKDVTSGKWESYKQFSSAIYFAVPKGLVTKAEIPDGCGLIVRSDAGWRVHKKPIINSIDSFPHEVWLKLLINGVDRAYVEQIKERPDANLWLTRERLNKKHGKEVSSLVHQALYAKEELEEKTQALKQESLKLQEEKDSHLKNMRDRVAQQFKVLEGDLAALATTLGLDPKESSPIDLAMAVRKASARLKEDNEVVNLRRVLDRVIQSANSALEPLPGE
jgi:hypothetical protein